MQNTFREYISTSMLIKSFVYILFPMVCFYCVKIEPERVFKVETIQVTEVSTAIWSVQGGIIDLGEKEITQHGFCYATYSNPTITDYTGIIFLGSTTSTGNFSSNMSDLLPGTDYFVRAFISNIESTTYGKVLPFTTAQASIEFPTVNTSAATSVEETTAMVGGNVTSDGGDSVTERGIYYGTSSDPKTTGTKVVIEGSTGIFSTTLSELTNGTEYFYVAYATNSEGTAYGTTMSFTTDQTEGVATVTTSDASSVGETSATVGGEITDDGGAPVTERGVYYGTSTSPQTAGTKKIIGSGIGAFSSTLTELSNGTDYYFVAYATNSAGTAYGSTLSFKTEQIQGVPTVETSAATSVGETAATVGGEVTDDGGATVTERGVYYGTSSNPQTSGTKKSIGSGSGIFSTNLTGLLDGITYYFVAYATNSTGTSYGTTENFTTEVIIVKPTVTTSEASLVEETTATVGGEVTDDGGGTVTERGIYYGTSSNPQSTGTKKDIGSGVGVFSTSLTDLMDGVTYYYVSYAINSAGTSYGTTLDFTTPLITTVTDYDDNEYPVVVIGNQTWMAKSLRTTHYADGSSIPLVESSSAWAGLEITAKAYCYYDNSASNGNTYGGLYTWAAAMNGATSSSSNPSGVQGVCPNGWHLPSDEEWKELEMYLGMSPAEADNTSYRGTDQGNKLKESSYAHWASPNAGNNSSGFTALGGGFRLEGEGTFGYLNNAVAYWTATQSSSTDAWDRTLQNDNSQVYRSDFPKGRGFYVRCIKD